MMSVISQQVYLPNQVPDYPIIEISNIGVTYPEGGNVGGIHWVPAGTLVIIDADIPLPDSQFMVMFELLVSSGQVVQDVRRPATISNGRLNLQVRFKTSGNFVLSSVRLNKGLEAIGAQFRLAPFKIEFDVYDEV